MAQNRVLNPGGQPTTVTFPLLGKALRTKGEVKVMPSQTARKPIADAHTPVPKYQVAHRVGTLALTALLDQDLSWLTNVSDTIIQISYLNQVRHTFSGATFASEEGVGQQQVAGETDELSFSFTTYQEQAS